MKDFYFSNDEDERDFLKNKKWLIHSLIVDSVKKAKEEDLESIVVFRMINPINDFIMVTELGKDNWIGSLNKSLEYYESVEEYERCREITELINDIENDNNKTNRGKNKN
jgi:hypothetical protein